MARAVEPLRRLDPADYDDAMEAWIELVNGMHHGANHRVNPEATLAPLTAPLSELRVALVTTAGVHLADQEPFHTETVAGDPTVRVLPDDLDPSELRFSHTHYDTRAAEEDHNVVLPIDRLHELAERGRIGGSTRYHIGMMGFNPDPTRIATEAAPRVVELLTEAEAGAVVFVPG